jgi:signal transduction histidine kinase/HAMP domain-containing protein
MRWWLALVFAFIAAITAIFVASLLSVRSGAAVRERAEETAAGTAFSAALSIGGAEGERLPGLVDRAAQERRLALFVYDADGELITRPRSLGIAVDTVPQRGEALARAQAGSRFLATLPGERATVVGLPLAGDRVLLAFVPHPEYRTSLGAFRAEIAKAALLAVLAGAAVGLLIALFISRRLRRIAAAAAEIERGEFDRPLRSGFRDELGALAATVDRMRMRLRASFEELEGERDRLRKLLERLHEGVIALSRDGTVVFANSPAAHMLGVTVLERGDALPESWPDFSLSDLVRSLFEGGPLVETVVQGSNGRTYVVTGIPAGAEGETAVVVLSDMTERERQEQSEREFVTNAAHELRTPLQTILGAVEVLQGGAKERPDKRDRFLEHIERESKRLARLARALLILARAQSETETPRRMPVPLRPLLEEVAAGLPDSEGGVEVRVCVDDIVVFSDRDLLEQAVFNLAKNAVEHTRVGHVELKARKADAGPVAITVEDTGPGISPETQERVFDRFYRGATRDGEGFGLGLSIADQAVRTLGGRLELDSSPGRGTRATITIPSAVVKEAA